MSQEHQPQQQQRDPLTTAQVGTLVGTCVAIPTATLVAVSAVMKWCGFGTKTSLGVGTVAAGVTASNVVRGARKVYERGNTTG